MFALYHSNKIDTAIFAGGSWQPKLPLTNLYSPQTARRSRSTDAQTTSTQFTISMAQSVIARGIQIVGTNLSSAATYRISWYSDAGLTSQIGTTGFIAFGSTIDWSSSANWFDWMNPNFWLGSGSPIIDPDNQGVDIRHNFATPQSLQYVRVEFVDPTNASGYVELGYVFIGELFIPTFNVAPDPTYNRVSLTSVEQAVGGSQYFNRRGSRKRLVVTWPMLLKEEVLTDLDEIIRIHDIDRPVYVDLFPESDQASAFTTAFLARVTQLPETRLVDAYLEGDTGATIGFEFTQLL